MSSTIQPRTSQITIYQGDYLDELHHLERKHEAAVEAERTSQKRSGGKSEAAKIAAEYEALAAEAETTAIHVKVKALGRKVFRELRDKYPPRDGNEGDQALGVNEDEFFEEFVPASLVEPEFSTRAEAAAWTETLAPIDWERVKMQAWMLNVAAGADPKSGLSSRLTRNSDEI